MLNCEFCLLANIFEMWILCFSSSIFLEVIFSCYSTICERNKNKKSQKNIKSLHVHRCQILSELLLLFLVHFIGKKGFDKTLHHICVSASSYIHSVTVYLKILVHLQMLERTRKEEGQILGTLEHPVVLVWLFQQEFW